MTDATRVAILNANYIKARLQGHYDVLYANHNGRVAHEMIFDLRPYKHGAGPSVDEQDVAKRLMDYGFHAPTVSFPVAGTMMIEPTESESKDELDQFCDALIAIRAEIGMSWMARSIAGQRPQERPHRRKSRRCLVASAREQVAYPLPYCVMAGSGRPVAQFDKPTGDRNLICACPDQGRTRPVQALATAAAVLGRGLSLMKLEKRDGSTRSHHEIKFKRSKNFRS
jgi:glycine dehydrogenase